MSKSVAPSPISSSGVKQMRRVGRGSSGRGQVRDGGHDLRHAGLVVGAEQRVAGGGDDVVADLGARTGIVGRVEHGLAAGQLDHAAVVVAVHDRLDAAGGRVGADVHVRDQADHRRAAGPGSVAVT